jgi:allophanate hydrolase subunit 1
MRATLRGYWLRFGTEVDSEVNERVTALTRALLTDPPRGLTDIVPGYNSIYLEYDAHQITENEVRHRMQQLQELP